MVYGLPGTPADGARIVVTVNEMIEGIDRMQRLLLFFFALCAFMLIGTTPAHSQNLEETPQQVTERELDHLDTGFFSLIVSEADYRQIRYTLDYLLQHARDDAQTGNMTAAAIELRMAASYMRMDAGRGKLDVQKAVFASADELERLAALMDEGSTTPVDVVDAAVFDAHRAIAHYHQRRAETLIDADFDRQAGLAFQAALLHYEHAVLSAARIEDRPMPAERTEELDGWERLAQALIDTKPVSSTEAEQIIRRLGTEIEGLSEAIG